MTSGNAGKGQVNQMTNHEYLQRMDVNDFTDWLCRHMWNDYEQNGKRTGIDAQRYYSVRDILLMEHEEGDEPERENEPSCHTCEHLIGQPFKPECSLLGSFVDWGRWKGKAPVNCPLRPICVQRGKEGE